MNNASQSAAEFAGEPEPKQRKWPWILVAILLLAFWGVHTLNKTIRARTAELERLAAIFHQQLNSGDYAAIYNGSDQNFKNSVGGREKSDQLFGGIKRKLGNAGVSKLQGVGFNKDASGTFVYATFSTPFEEGDATEKINWKKSPDGYSLDSYEASQVTLLTPPGKPH